MAAEFKELMEQACSLELQAHKVVKKTDWSGVFPDLETVRAAHRLTGLIVAKKRGVQLLEEQDAVLERITSEEQRKIAKQISDQFIVVTPLSGGIKKVGLIASPDLSHPHVEGKAKHLVITEEGKVLMFNTVERNCIFPPLFTLLHRGQMVSRFLKEEERASLRELVQKAKKFSWETLAPAPNPQ